MKPYVFWVQSERWETEHRSMSVLALKYFVKVGLNYACHQEHPVETVLADDHSVDLTCEPRFIFVPPANY